MRVERQVDGQVSSILNRADVDMQSSPGKNSRPRKVTIQLSWKVFEKLSAAIERPGVGKSMVIEAALERFLSPTPPMEELMQQYFDQIRSRLDQFETDMQIVAETVALHARYHLTVMPPLPEAQQREACLRGEERFKVLAEQVDRRIRLGRPLIRETIDRLSAANLNERELDTAKHAARVLGPEQVNEEPGSPTEADIQDDLHAAAREGGSNPNFRHLPNSFCSPA